VVVESDQNQVIMLLDFEKAYDSLLGYYARYNERTLGFSKICITWILALYKNAQALVIINNT